jgi:hypothetical protein
MLLILLAGAGCDVTVEVRLREHKDPAAQPAPSTRTKARSPARAEPAAHKRPTKGPVELR